MNAYYIYIAPYNNNNNILSWTVRAAGRRRLHNAPGGGGRPARGTSATEIAKTYFIIYRGTLAAPQPLRDMCANEKERGRTGGARSTVTTTTTTTDAMAVIGGRWTVVRRE